MPGPRLEDLWSALQDLGERDEEASDRKAEVAAQRLVRGSCDEADKGNHVGQGKELSEGDSQVELRRDIEEEVVDEVDGREAGEDDS